MDTASGSVVENVGFEFLRLSAGYRLNGDTEVWSMDTKS